MRKIICVGTWLRVGTIVELIKICWWVQNWETGCGKRPYQNADKKCGWHLNDAKQVLKSSTNAMVRTFVVSDACNNLGDACNNLNSEGNSQDSLWSWPWKRSGSAPIYVQFSSCLHLERERERERRQCLTQVHKITHHAWRSNIGVLVLNSCIPCGGVAPANGVVPTCASTLTTAAEQCQAKCNDKISTRSPNANVAWESPQTGVHANV